MKFLKFAFLFVCISGIAQTKVGSIDIDFIMSKMPELTSVQEGVDAYGKTLEDELKGKVSTYDAAIKSYQEQESSLTILQRKEKQEAIIAMEEDINKYNQNATQLITLKRQELLQPLYNKIGVELEKIAKAEGYTQIFQRNTNLIYTDNRFDLTLGVMKALGIELKEGE